VIGTGRLRYGGGKGARYASSSEKQEQSSCRKEGIEEGCSSVYPAPGGSFIHPEMRAPAT
jgi:hypothetical protein